MNSLCSHCQRQKLNQKVTVDGRGFICRPPSSTYLCRQVDVRLIELLLEDKGDTSIFELNELLRLKRIITKNARDVLNLIGTYHYDLPRNFFEFEDLLLTTHKTLFEDTGILSIGNYREGSVSVDINNHAFEGSDASDIQKDLRFLWDNLLEPAFKDINNGFTPNKQGAAMLCALFLSQFFRIHPFRDGNGRVGRCVVKTILVKCGLDIFYSAPGAMTEPQLTRRYIKALRFSHKRYHAAGFSPLNYRDTKKSLEINKWLAHFLSKLIAIRVPDAEEEVAPVMSYTPFN